MTQNQFSFEINAKIPDALGRAGIIHTPHGDIHTPNFVVVGTYAKVKFLEPQQFHNINAQVMISNGFHLSKIDDEIEKAGGLSKYSGYNCPTITDSGGFQVMSFGSGLGKVISMDKRNIAREQFKTDKKRHLSRVTDDGVYFKRNEKDDEKLFTPEYSMEFQHKIGADIIMAFDELTNIGDSREYNEEALDRTYSWAKRCLTEHKKLTKERVGKPYQGLFGVLQGAHYQDLREKAARDLGAMDFDGYGIGGAFEKEQLPNILFWVNSILPESKPRHLLGLSKPDDIFIGVENGCDTFDCVAPTREARHGKVYTLDGDINIRNAKFAEDPSPLFKGCECPTCKSQYTRGKINKLLKNKDGLKTEEEIIRDKQIAIELITTHNVHFIIKLTQEIRKSIIDGNFFDFRDKWLKRYYK
ncbi:tRNA guanosine(34) transglycosylase Tgt [Methanobrevibacter sp. TMH8]|uniref:tRNA guanosine(34) transglycosylase Tgt n=1 Tax=Methanobrevibacter sp. TMH8 TaxID=2848611 RepID=UPI001CCEE061|nr:tRNA guanosine(34) transglycosylase Tgt [Methanobrevibacter sp. TMH8]MBZ9571523.1 tRNA guanosine(34) transglycosylase Tgt [Methanobrevibacter sp. TMH8]